MKKNKIFERILQSERAAFVIDEEKFSQNIQDLRNAFLQHYPKVKIGYSYKTNYIPTICKLAHENGCLAEVVSEMEVEMALRMLADPSQIIYNGPAKSYKSLEQVILHKGIVNIDHLDEVELVNKILSQHPQHRAKVAIRLSFDYEEHLSRFGVDLEKSLWLEEVLLENEQVELLGFHFHLPFRNIKSFEFRLSCLLETLERSKNKNITYINIGGGFYGKLDDEMLQVLGISEAPSYEDYASLIGKKLTEYFHLKNQTMPTLYLEPGSSVVADALYFISKIHAVKKIQERNYVITYAARHLLSPTNKAIQLPLKIVEGEAKKPEEEYLVVGYTCIEGDILGKGSASKILDSQSSFVVIKNVGSYSVVMGSDFILPQPAIYSFIKEEIKSVRKSKSVDEIYNSFF